MARSAAWLDKKWESRTLHPTLARNSAAVPSVGILMKLKTVRLDPLLVPTSDPLKLRHQYSHLKEQLLRSAHTDYHTRTEREHMRESLVGLSETHREITGVSLQ